MKRKLLRALGAFVFSIITASAASGQNAVRAYSVRGRVFPDAQATAGSPVVGFLAPTAPPRGNVAEIAGQTDAGTELKQRVVLAPDGWFEFVSIPPGKYRLTILPKTSLAPIDVRVTDSNVEANFGPTPARVSAVVSLEDGGPPPPFELRFHDLANGGLRSHVRVAGGLAAELPAGSYRLDAVGLPAGFNVRSITRAGVDLTSAGLKLAGAESVELAITLRSAAAWSRVSGRVARNPDGPAVATVTLSGENAAATLKAVVNADGSFEFPKVLPGTYVARLQPSSVDLPTTVVVAPGGVTALQLASPTAQDFAGDFVTIAPGEFVMGCADEDPRCQPDEKPARRVAITREFEIGKYEVTQKQWVAVMGENPSEEKGDSRPVDGISWQEAQGFIARLNALGGKYRYRLPTEAEWEFAARGGKTEREPDAAALNSLGWFESNAEGETQPVGKKTPNAWGLYDMRGNVAEWVEDWYDITYYGIGPALDPAGPLTGSRRVSRGGSAGSDSKFARLSVRAGQDGPSRFTGLRLARERRR